MIRCGLFIVAKLSLIAPAIAHHSFAMFDKTKEVELKNATVKDWQWTGPHTWLYVLVPSGTVTSSKYSMEGGNPGLMRREGFSEGSLVPDDKVTLYVLPLLSGEKSGSVNAVRLRDGKLLGERLKPQ